MIKLELLSKEESKERFVKPKSIKNTNIIVGKFNLFHAGHMMMYKYAYDENAFVFVGEDRLEERIELFNEAISLSKINPAWVKVYYSEQGYLPSIVSQISNGQKIAVTAGSDRLADYKRQLRSAEMADDILFIESDRYSSSTHLMQKIKDSTWDSYDALDNPWIEKHYGKIYGSIS